MVSLSVYQHCSVCKKLLTLQKIKYIKFEDEQLLLMHEACILVFRRTTRWPKLDSIFDKLKTVKSLTVFFKWFR